MKIDGAGGCFENRMYEVSRQVAWKFVKECILEMDLAVETLDEQNCLASGKLKKDEGTGIFAMLFQNNHHKLFQTAVQDVENESTVQVVFDVHKKVPTAYQWSKQDEEVKNFYDRFDQKMDEYLHFAICPHCKTKVARKVKFCPNCGKAMQ